MKALRIVVLLGSFAASLGVSPSSQAQIASAKRGWAGSNAAQINGSNSSWYYRWWHDIPADAAGSVADFVPLIKFYSTPENLQQKLNSIKAIPGVDTLLVLNEPERVDQSDVTVADAIGLWPQVQSELPNHKLVSPGVSDDASGQAWLTSFFNQVNARNNNTNSADDLRVDSVAFHWYGASTPNNVAGTAASFLNRVQWYHDTFDRPVWITEFAIHDWAGNYTDEQIRVANAEFLDIVIPALESRSYVERYSFYQHFSDANIYNTGTSPLAPSVVGDAYAGTLGVGQSQDLAGQSLGLTTAYLRGGQVRNSGAALPDALRVIDALSGVSTISADNDWSLYSRRDSGLRVRSGATLVKTGDAAIDVTGGVILDGSLRVADGELAITAATLSGGGNTTVDAGATLTLDAGRGVYSFSSHDFRVAGTVNGPLLATAGSSVTPTGAAPVFNGAVTVRGSALDVGGAGFTHSVPSSLSPVAAGLRLAYDAALDTPGDNVWSDALGSADGVTFSQSASPAPVSSPQFPSLTAAYDTGDLGGASGLVNYFEAAGPRSRRDAAFEVVFNVQNASAGVNQVLLEVGGANTGAALVLNNGTLTFNVDGDGGDANLTQGVGAGWRHAVGVIDLTAAEDSISLYIDGALAGTLGGLDIDDWAGGNNTGLGAGSDSVTGVTSGSGAPFHGQIALARYYEDHALDAADVLQNYGSLIAAPTLEPTTARFASLQVESGSTTRLDISSDGRADKLVVDGVLGLNGAALEVAIVAGGQVLAAGDTFDLIDAGSTTGTFASVLLPTLGEGLQWSVGRLTVDGMLAVTLDGDFNGDGNVDAADYTVYRDALGSTTTRNSGADASGDGVVNGTDLSLWRAAYGRSIQFDAFTQSIAVPEPATMAVLPLCFAWFATRSPRSRRR